MKLIKSKAELIQQGEGLSGLYSHIELCGRTCYKSEDKIIDGSATVFIQNLIKRGHTAMLEHGTVYLAIPYTDEKTLSHYRGVAGKYNEIEFTKYSKVTMMRGTHNYVTTNYRVLVENNWLDDLQYICEPTEYHEKRYTFRMLTSIGVTRELNRHRSHSIAEQSTRYCNYSTDKFDNQVSFCKPSWINLNLGIYEVVTNKDGTKDISGDGYVKDVQNYDSDNLFLGNCIYCEDTYMNLLENGWQPQQAREVLPLCTATEIIHTAFEDDWKHFFNLRYFEKTGKVHPNMLELTTLMKEECEKANIWNNIIKDNNENKLN